MSQNFNTVEKPNNEEVIDEITRDFESQFTVNDQESKVKDGENLAARIAKEHSKLDNMPDEFKNDDELVGDNEEKIREDDYIDEDKLKDLEMNLTDEQKENMYKQAIELKVQGNDEFKAENYLASIETYTKALRLCPLAYPKDRSILYANRAASKAKLNSKESAIEDCTKAVELNASYIKAYLRRANLYEESDKLDESLADYKKILELDRGNKEALQAQYRLPPKIDERNEKMKTEMLGKLKDLGNMILRPFGLSTENFQLNQDSNSGGYSINFKQNH